MVFSQENNNLKNGFAAQGYDVVAYFKNKVEKGKAQYRFTYNQVNYKFHTAKNLKIFQQNPKEYLPQYGGFCAYAIAKDSKKVKINPKTYIITNGKLYLFYNSWGINTLTKWTTEGPKTLQKLADSNWEVILNSK